MEGGITIEELVVIPTNIFADTSFSVLLIKNRTYVNF